MPKPKAKRRLKNLNVEFISIVDAGANQRTVIYKNRDIEEIGDQIQKQISFRKSDDDKRLLYGVVYAPGEVDAHEDTMTAEEIEKAAHAFLAAGKTNRVDKQHDENPDKGFVVESSILKGEHPDFPNDPEGTWYVVLKVTDDETWQQVKDGDLKGLSMQGYAEAESLEETDVEKAEFIIEEVKKYFAPMFQNMKKFLKGVNMTNNEGRISTFTEVLKAVQSGEIEIPEEIRKDFDSSLGSEELRQAIYALDSANWNAMHDEDVSDKKAQLLENAQQFIDHVNGLTISKQQTQTEDETMSDETKNKDTEVEKSEETAKSPELEAIEALTKTVGDMKEDFENRLAKVEKSANGSQTVPGQEDDDDDPQPVKKSALGIFPGIG